MSDGAIVHCPRCGVSFYVRPPVRATEFYGTFVRFTFSAVDVNHECEDER